MPDEFWTLVFKLRIDEKEQVFDKIENTEEFYRYMRRNGFPPFIQRISEDQWKDKRRDVIYTTRELIENYGSRMMRMIEGESYIPPQVEEILSTINVTFISADRLMVQKKVERPYGEDSIKIEQKVEVITQKLAKLMGETIQKYAEFAQSKDHTFPARAITEKNPMSVEAIQEKLTVLEQKRNELIQNGILEEERDIDVRDFINSITEKDMLVFSEAFDKFIALSASNEKVVSIRQCRDLIVFAAAQFGALRYVSARDALYLSFDGLKLKDFIDKSSLSVDLRKLVEKVRSRSCSKGRSIDVTVDQLVSKMNDVLREYQPNLLCNGHDTLEVLSLSLAKRFATYDMSDYPEERLFESLAMGFSREMFVKSNLYRCYKEHIQ